MSSSFPPPPGGPSPFQFPQPGGAYPPPQEPTPPPLPTGGGYPGPNQFGQPPAYPPGQRRVSLLALASLITAIASPFMLCMCVPALISSFVSITTGLASIYFINRSDGKLTGVPLAMIGIVIALPVFGLSLAFTPSFVAGFRQGASGEPRAPLTGLERAEHAIQTNAGGRAHGNSPEAIELAKSYSELLLTMREAAFTEGKKGPSLTGGQFITWCELHGDRCAFVVHVPNYRNFDDDAKEALAELAWMAAQLTVGDKLQPGDQLAVGLKGVLLYGSVMTGRVSGDEGDEGKEPDSTGIDPARLHPFFPEETVPDLNIDLGDAEEAPPMEVEGKEE